MLATLCDHAMREMMVVLRKRVECSGKIAMTALSHGWQRWDYCRNRISRGAFFLDDCNAELVNHELGSGLERH
jgi:hypothetical protein